MYSILSLVSPLSLLLFLPWTNGVDRQSKESLEEEEEELVPLVIWPGMGKTYYESLLSLRVVYLSGR